MAHSRKFPYVQACKQRARLYASLHNYTFFDLTMNMPKFRNHSVYWMKLYLVRQTMEQRREGLRRYDWVMWLDSDAWVANLDTRLEDLLPERTDNITEIVVSHDDEGINAGVWLIRNTPSAEALLDSWMAYEKHLPFTNEQQAIRDIYNRRAYEHVPGGLPSRFDFSVPPWKGQGRTTHLPARGFRRVRQCAMNSTPAVGVSNETFMYGDFIVHFFGMGELKQFGVDLMASEKLLHII